MKTTEVASLNRLSACTPRKNRNCPTRTRVNSESLPCHCIVIESQLTAMMARSTWLYTLDMYACLCPINPRLKIRAAASIEYTHKIAASIARSGDFANSLKLDIARVDSPLVASSTSVTKCANITTKTTYSIACECMIRKTATRARLSTLNIPSAVPPIVAPGPASDLNAFRASPGGGNLLFEGLATGADISILKDTNGHTPTLYWRAAAIDVWGDDTNPSAEQTITGDLVQLTDGTDNLTDGTNNLTY